VSRRVVAFDLETCLIEPGLQAPQLVCLTWQEGEFGEAHIVDRFRAESILRPLLEDKDVVFVGHNVAFDFAVVCEWIPSLLDLVFQAYADDRVTDTMIRQRLLDIAAGVAKGRRLPNGKHMPALYDLASLARRNTGMVLLKDAWRLSYSGFLAYRLEQWPERALELQSLAREKLAEVDRKIKIIEDNNPKSKAKELTKALWKERQMLLDMIEGDASRCTEYPLDDARATSGVYFAQEKHIKYLDDQYRQTRYYFALHLSSTWGICVDGPGVQSLKAAIAAERDELEAELVEAGLVREDGTCDMKAAKARMVAVCREQGLDIIFTDKHHDKDDPCKAGDACEEHIKLDADACDRTEDDLLIAFATRKTLTKQLTTDIPALEKGVYFPIHTKYWLAETGRSTSSKPNIQNQSNRPGFRESFIARPGCLFFQNDFATLELYTLAQCCVSWLGYSKLAETLLSGKDPHLMVAATILRKPYEWCLENKNLPEVKKARKQAKPANFGFAGGMGAEKFVYSTRKQVVAIEGREAWEAMELTVERVRRLKQEWFETYPEMREYLARAGKLCEEDGYANVVTLFSNRHRGRASYCATANNGFQTLGSDIAKTAMWRVAQAQYVDRNSPLFGTRTVAFVHDEIIGEARAEIIHEAAFELRRVMTAAANEWLPDVPMVEEKMDPVAMKRWSKKAVQRFDATGRLIAWDAELLAA
jgi:DNA polymerase-1